MVNTWIDVTTQGVTAGGDAATNTARLNTLIAGIKAGRIGATVYFPAGRYEFDGSIVIDDSSATENSLTRISLKGDGAGATQLQYNGTGTFILYKGMSYGQPAIIPEFGYFSFESLRIQCFIGEVFTVAGTVTAGDTLSVTATGPVIPAQLLLGGTVTAGDTLSVTASSAALGGSPVTVTSIIGTGDTVATAAAALCARLQGTPSLAALLFSTPSAGLILVADPTGIAVTWSTAVGGAATETLLATQAGAVSVTTTTVAGDTPATAATALCHALQATPALALPGLYFANPSPGTVTAANPDGIAVTWSATAGGAGTATLTASTTGFVAGSIGISLNCAAYVVLRDLVLTGWCIAAYLLDCYNLLFENCNISVNLLGTYGEGIWNASAPGFTANAACPASITFLNCQYANNFWGGVALTDCAACAFIGCTIINNGGNTALPKTANPTFGIGLANDNLTPASPYFASQGPWGASFDSTLFQDNFGAADIYLQGGNGVAGAAQFYLTGVAAGASLELSAASAGIANAPVGVSYTPSATDSIASAATALFGLLQANANLTAAGLAFTLNNYGPYSVLAAFAPAGLPVAWTATVAGEAGSNFVAGQLAVEGPTGLLVQGCSFSRTLDSCAQACIRLDVGPSPSGWPTPLVLLGNGFAHYGYGYTPSRARPYVSVPSGQIFTIGGAITPGDTLSITASGNGLGGAPVTVGYTAVAGDTLAAAAAALCGLLAANAALAAAGIVFGNATPAAITASVLTGLTVMWSSAVAGAGTESITATPAYQAPYQVTDWGNLYGDAAERPNFAGPIQGGKALASAWATFDGSNGYVRQSFNIASLTRNGPGNYTLAFQKPMIFRANTDNPPAALFTVGGMLAAGDTLALTASGQNIVGAPVTTAYTTLAADSPASAAAALCGLLAAGPALSAAGLLFANPSPGVIAASARTSVAVAWSASATGGASIAIASNADYAVTGGLNGIGFFATGAKTPASVTVLTYDRAGKAADFSDISVSCHGGNTMI